MYGDGEGAFYPPARRLALIAEKANRPIIVAAETFLKPGGIGGYVASADGDRDAKPRSSHFAS